MAEAIAGGIGTGLFKDFKVAKEMVKVAETHYPNESLRDIYDAEYEIFVDAYNALVPIYERQQSIA